MRTLHTSNFMRRLFRSLIPLALLSSAFGQALPYLFESDGSGPPNKIYWQTEPGVRYDLWKSDDLAEWTRVTGYPAVAEGLAMEHAFTPGPKGFFQVLPIDEQPPVMTGSFPDNGAFGVARFGKISIGLSDATGINPASIQLTVGGRGTFQTGSAELSFTDGVLVFDGGGDTALGAYGEAITISLQVSDSLGNSGVRAFSFELETQPQLAPDLFVFGSPAALRAGQRVGAIATRALIKGPVRMDDPTDPWTLETVAADRIVLAYTGATAPVFAGGTYLCNRTPATVSEIFYRKITAVNDAPATKKLTLMTQDVGLEEIITDGAFSTTTEGLAFEVGADGSIVRALAGSPSVPLGDLGYSLDGTTFELTRSDGLTLLSAQFEQLHWWLRNCRFRSSIDLGWNGGLRRMEGVFEGDLDMAMIYNADVTLTGQSLEDEIFNLPFASEPKILVPLGPVAFALVRFDLKLRAEAEAAALMNFRAGYRQSGRIDGLGCRYDKPDFSWINNITFSPTTVEPFTAQLSGRLSLKLKLAPSVSFLVYGLAGAELALEPNGGVVVETDSQNILNSRLEAGVDLRLSSSGPALDWLRPQPSLVRTLWQTEWPLTSNQPPSPAITTQPKDVTANVGGSARFTCAVNRSDNVSWQWYQNGVALPGKDKSYLDLVNLAANHAGSYSVKVKVGGTTLQSNNASLYLGDPATYFQYPFEDHQWQAEFPPPSSTDEKNGLYPDHAPVTGNPSRGASKPTSGWYVSQDVGSYLSSSDYEGIHAGEDWNYVKLVDDDNEYRNDDIGQPVYPVANGTVVRVAQAGVSSPQSLGYYVVIKHTLDESIRKSGESGEFYSLYVHIAPHIDGVIAGKLRDASFGDINKLPSVGNRVTVNTLLGYIGTTTAVWPHLHLEMREISIDQETGAKIPVIDPGHPPHPLANNWYYPQEGTWSDTYLTMRDDAGIIDPSDFIDDHGGAAVNNPATDGFALIPAGSFQMGDQSDPRVGSWNELPVHSVYVNAFYMGKYEVTQGLWDAVRAWGLANGYTDLPAGSYAGPPYSKGANHPVECLPWYDIVKWCNARSQKEGLTPCYTVAGVIYKTGYSYAVVCNWSANGYRLPTEAEWEKAARGGLSGKNFPWGDTISHSQANYCVKSDNGTTNYYSYDVTSRPSGSVTFYYHPTYNDGVRPYTSPVGSFGHNGYGLYDMAGNVREWCWDLYDQAQGKWRVTRGGCWGNDANYARCSDRSYDWPLVGVEGNDGFRLVRGQP